MNLENYLFKLLMLEPGYSVCRDYINPSELEVNLKKILKLIDKLYDKGSKEIHIDDIKALFMSEYPSLEKDVIFGLIDSIFELEVSEEVQSEILLNYKNKCTANQLGQLSLKYMDEPDKFDIEELKDIIDKYETGITVEEDGTLLEFSLDELLEKEMDESGYSWPWPDMDGIAGKMKGGSLSLVFAPPNTGKSAFCHTSATHFASQCRVLFINNEERASKVYLRAMSCWSEMSKTQIAMNRDECLSRWSVIKPNYFYRDTSNLSMGMLKKYIKQDKPDIIFIDQAVKIKIKEAGRHDLTITEIFKELREIVKEFDVDIVGVSQGDGTTYNKDWLSMGDIANCKIGIQGEVDNLIGLSRPNDGDFVNISFPKAKETGNESGRMVLELIKDISRLVEIQ